MRQFLIIFFVLVGFNSNAHKYFISIADMEYDSLKNRINVSLKMTAHDFERMLENKFDKKFELEKISDSSKVGQYIVQYLQHNFRIESGDQELKMNYLGREVNDRDELLCYFFFPNVPDHKTVNITNRLLFSLSDQQQNIVHYKCLGRTKSVTLFASNYEGQITFNEDEED